AAQEIERASCRRISVRRKDSLCTASSRADSGRGIRRATMQLPLALTMPISSGSGGLRAMAPSIGAIFLPAAAFALRADLLHILGRSIALAIANRRAGLEQGTRHARKIRARAARLERRVATPAEGRRIVRLVARVECCAVGDEEARCADI